MFSLLCYIVGLFPYWGDFTYYSKNDCQCYNLSLMSATRNRDNSQLNKILQLALAKYSYGSQLPVFIRIFHTRRICTLDIDISISCFSSESVSFNRKRKKILQVGNNKHHTPNFEVQKRANDCLIEQSLQCLLASNILL